MGCDEKSEFPVNLSLGILLNVLSMYLTIKSKVMGVNLPQYDRREILIVFASYTISCSWYL